jgi:hypothetical protein
MQLLCVLQLGQEGARDSLECGDCTDMRGSYVCKYVHWFVNGAVPGDVGAVCSKAAPSHVCACVRTCLHIRHFCSYVFGYVIRYQM